MPVQQIYKLITTTNPYQRDGAGILRANTSLQLPVSNYSYTGIVVRMPFIDNSFVALPGSTVQPMYGYFLQVTGSNAYIKLSALKAQIVSTVTIKDKVPSTFALPGISNFSSNDAGLLNENISNAGGDWIGALIGLVGTTIDSGFKYGANKDTVEALKEQTRLMGLSEQIQAGYGAVGNDMSSEMLATALGKSYSQQNPAPATVDSNKLVWLALIAAAALVAVFFIVKSEGK